MKFLILLFIFIGNVAFSSQTYNCSYFNQIDVGTTTVSTKVLSQNAMRRCLMIQNHGPAGASSVLIKFGAAHTGTEGLSLAGSSTTLEFVNVPVGSVYLKANPVGGFSTTILEGK